MAIGALAAAGRAAVGEDWGVMGRVGGCFKLMHDCGDGLRRAAMRGLRALIGTERLASGLLIGVGGALPNETGRDGHARREFAIAMYAVLR